MRKIKAKMARVRRLRKYGYRLSKKKTDDIRAALEAAAKRARGRRGLKPHPGQGAK